jgi:hypothetical protein
VIEFIKLSRLRCAKYGMGLNDSDPAKKVMMFQPRGSRTRGRQSNSWMYKLEKDAETLDGGYNR